MTDTERLTAKQAAADEVATYIRQVMDDLHQRHGLPWDCIAAVVHAEAVSAMTAIYGGPMAAQCCERAAERVRNLPSAAAHALAFAAPAGSA